MEKWGCVGVDGVEVPCWEGVEVYVRDFEGRRGGDGDGCGEGVIVECLRCTFGRVVRCDIPGKFFSVFADVCVYVSDFDCGSGWGCGITDAFLSGYDVAFVFVLHFLRICGFVQGCGYICVCVCVVKCPCLCTCSCGCGSVVTDTSFPNLLFLPLC